MASSPAVRLAQHSDVNDLIALVHEAHEEEHLGPVASLSEQAVFSTILRAIAGNATIGVIDGDGEIASSCFLEPAAPWYSATGILSALWFHTRAAYRKAPHSKTLLTWARERAQRLNCPLQVEVPLSEASKPRFELYQRQLGQPAGLSFVYEPHPNAPTPAPGTTVEAASSEDADSVVEVARELSRENGLYDTSEDLAIPMLRDALGENGIIGLIRSSEVKRSDDIEATIFLRLAKPFYSHEPFLDEYFAYVRPQYRKSSNAKSLIQFARRQSDRLNLPLRIGVVSKTELNRKIQMYSRVLNSAPSCAHFTYFKGIS